MEENTLSAIIQAEMTDAIGFLTDDGGIVDEREKALDYYYARPFGNEIDGRSKVVTSDVADVIESVLPSLMRIFTASEKVVSFEPRQREDEEYAAQATDYTNYVFNVQNNGFHLLYTAFKDALLQKTGVLKYYWEEKEEVTQEAYENVTEEEFLRLTLPDNVQVLNHDEFMSPAGILHNFTRRVKELRKQVRIEVVPPEEFGIARRSRSVEDSDFTYHQTEKMVGDLVAMGFDEDEVRHCAGNSPLETSSGKLSRYQSEGIYSDGNDIDPSRRKVLYTECYIRVDYDGDGIPELRKVTCVGGNYKILENVRLEVHPLVLLTPVPMPHTAIGRSLADQTMDIQLIKSTLVRQILDNLYHTNNPRHILLENEVNIEDFMTDRPGGGIRATRSDAVTPLMVNKIGQEPYTMLEYMDGMREQRTGVTRYNQGLDADTLNQTATGVNRITDFSMMRIELIARHFAEQLKPLFSGILKLVTEHVDEAQVIRLRGEFVEMDPSQWRTQYDVQIHVGLGTGNKDQQMLQLNNIYTTQQQLVQQFGIGGFVSLENLWATLEKLVEAADLKQPDMYFTPPDKSELLSNPPPPAPDMNVVLLQRDLDLKEQRQQQDFIIKQQELEIEREQLRIKAAESNIKLRLEQTKVGLEALNAN